MSSLEAIAPVFSERMLNCLAEGLAIAVFAWVWLRVVGRQNSGTRFAVWFSALVTIAALPLFSSRTGVPAGIGVRPTFTLPGSWGAYLFAGWAVAASIGLARLGFGLWQVRQLRRSSVELNLASLDGKLERWADEFVPGKDFPDSARTGHRLRACANKKNRRAARICVSDAVRVPTAIGFFKPIVVMPRWAIEELSPTELNAVVLHELAHLRRWDDWTNLAQKIIAALFFFHPAVWWIEKRLSLEREMASDDLVLEQTANPRAYAECLVCVAEKSFLHRGLTLVQAAVNRMRQTTERVLEILDRDRPGSTRISKPALIVLIAFALICVFTVEHAPRLIAFADTNLTPPRTLLRPSREGSRQAVVIPAALDLDSAHPPQTASGGKLGQKRELTPGVVLPSSANVVKPHTPIVVRASQREPVRPPATLLVVIEHTQLDGRGTPIWTLCVWRVTLVSPAANRFQEGVPAKSI